MTITFTEQDARALDGAGWLSSRRAGAAARLAGLALPTTAEEAWRYSRIEELDLARYRPCDGPAARDLPPGCEELLAEAGSRSALLVFRNGHLVHREVDEELSRLGVVVSDLGSNQEADGLVGTASAASADAFVDLHDAFMVGGAFVRVPDGVSVEAPVVVLQWSEGEGLASFPHTLVVAGEGSSVTVLDRYSSGSDDHLVDAVVEILAGEGSRVTYQSEQHQGSRVWHVALQRAHAARRATVRSSALALGGSYARLRSEALLSGEGASSEMMAAYFASGTQMLDFRTLQDHQAPSTTSNLLFKGAVVDEARSVYSGLIRLGRTAQKADAHQTNRNLVLSEGASAESIPNLEIEANDVKCSHASAVGPVDEDQIYYLGSRGLPPDVAERLVVLGFFDDVIERLPMDGLASALRRSVAAKFEDRRFEGRRG